MTRRNGGGEHTQVGTPKKRRGKRLLWPGQSGRIYERNAVVETRSVSVTSRRLRCRLATTGCYRPPCSSQRANQLVLILTKDYACLPPPLHIVPLPFTASLFFSAIILPSQACPLRFSLYRPLTLLLQSPRFDPSCEPSSSYINILLFLHPSPIHKSLSLLACFPNISDSSHNGLISPRSGFFK